MRNPTTLDLLKMHVWYEEHDSNEAMTDKCRNAAAAVLDVEMEKHWSEGDAQMWGRELQDYLFRYEEGMSRGPF